MCRYMFFKFYIFCACLNQVIIRMELSCLRGFSEASPSSWNLRNLTGGCARRTPPCSAPRTAPPLMAAIRKGSSKWTTSNFRIITRCLCLWALQVGDGTLIPFKYDDLCRVTKNFSEKLGGGSFGFVFKGTMPDSTQVAGKKLEGILQGEKQARMEGTRRLLVYDYMPKGSLATVLFGDSSWAVDRWMRYQIILGMVRGLAYLHEKCRDCNIHCNIKPENILLDASFVPKVADFRLVKLQQGADHHVRDQGHSS
ncbi:hypothetical protein Taro_001336 [Colocasia esculenta]|uniref:Protein kinase domain-containing protein n=1 Tax=Colocasia esculenta TaxID=4460 RepID=A0A843TAS6_COLES|nr:hypothetical protein [Colocasia esculenta]